MKINGVGNVGGINPYNRNQESKANQAIGKKDNKKDAVQISSEAKELLGAQGSAEPDSQNQKIQELKQSVSAGTYQVEARKVAEKLFPYIK